MSARGRAAWLLAGLVLLVLTSFAGVLRNGFIDFDDNEYVYENPEVVAGLSWSGIAWAFTTTRAANWHPLTWLSHMADVELFGLRPAGHHATSALLHAATVAMLFVALRALTGAVARSAAVAALFGVHPLRVESVAWVAERKDVLSLLFAVLALAAYARYVRGRRRGDLALVALAFAASLLAKPTAVTLPLLLLLLDVWPLGRWRVLEGNGGWRRGLAECLREKVPLLAMSVASSAVTYWAQWGDSATMQLRHISLVQRLSNALVSYARYVEMTIWPSGLAVFYPHPASVGVELWPKGGTASLALLLGISGLALAQARRLPYLIVGWSWFVGALVPMIGLVQVGAQAMADRYSYLPSIGLLLALVWGASDLCTRWAVPRTAVVGGVSLILLGSAALTWRQVARWHDASSLYEHALRVTEKNWLAWNNLGVQYLQRGEPVRALEMLSTSRSIMPGNALAWYNSGVALAEMRRPGEALSCYRESARLDPNDERTLINLGVLLLDLGQAAEAIVWLERALALQPEHPVALYDLAIAHARHGDPARASEYTRRLRSVDPAQAAELARRTGVPP